MRYKILLTGRNETIISDFFVQMDDRIEFMTSSLRRDDILTHVTYFQPDVLCYCAYNETWETASRIGGIKQRLDEQDVIVAVTGPEEDCSVFLRESYDTANLVVPNPPRSEEIVSRIIKYLEENGIAARKNMEAGLLGALSPNVQGRAPKSPSARPSAAPGRQPGAGAQAYGAPAAGTQGGAATGQPQPAASMSAQRGGIPGQPQATGQQMGSATGQPQAMNAQRGSVPVQPQAAEQQRAAATGQPQSAASTNAQRGTATGQPQWNAPGQPQAPASGNPEPAVASGSAANAPQGSAPAGDPNRIDPTALLREVNAFLDDSETKRKHILVIDDNPMMLKVIQEHLHNEYDVATAISARVANRFLSRKKTDLILLDYEMPDIDGPSFLEQLRKDPATKDIPVIFVTGTTERKKIAQALVMKPQGYLLKPIDRDKLLATIKKVLGGNENG